MALLSMKVSITATFLILLLAFVVGWGQMSDGGFDRDLSDAEMARIHGRQTAVPDCVGCAVFNGKKPECAGTNKCNWCVTTGPSGVGKSCGPIETIFSGDTTIKLLRTTPEDLDNDDIHVHASRDCWSQYECITEPPLDETRCENSNDGGCTDDTWVCTFRDCNPADSTYSEIVRR